MSPKDWSPEQYLRFSRERKLPSVDLLSRITEKSPANVIDVGCGPGNSTRLLKERWPSARVVGLDNSPAMIERAKTDSPGGEWLLAEAGTARIEGTFDLAFSNATIQWVPDHPGLMQWFRNLLNKDGVLAVQIPLFSNMPLGASIDRVSKSIRWEKALGTVGNLLTFHTPREYFDMLSPLFSSIEMWETRYIHIFDDQRAIFDMISSTGLRPYVNALATNEERNAFEAEVYETIRKDYPLQNNGQVLFPFYRLFFTGIAK